MIGIGLKKMNEISEYLDSLFPNPKCELIYHSDYELLLCTVLSAQSTDKRVNSVTPILFSKYPSLKALKCANREDLERIIRPIGTSKRKAYYIQEIARIIEDEYHGVVPVDRDLLMKFPGVGRKTINVFFSEFYHIPAFAVDTHVERVARRLKLCSLKDDVLIIEKKLMRKFPKEEWGRRHLQFVLFGRYYCKAVKPKCSQCKLIHLCREKKKNLVI